MNIESILRTAIKIEEEGIKFYLRSAAKIKDENGKGILMFLVNEEKRHLAFFEAMLKKHGKGDHSDIKMLVTPRIFPELSELEEGKTTGADIRVLEHARETELRSIDLYESALMSASDRMLRSGVEIILKEERQHLEWIEYLLENINRHEYWGGLQGHFSLDGG